MPDLSALAESVLMGARAGEDVEAYVSWNRQTSVRAYDGAVEHLASAESSGIGVRVVLGDRVGFAYSGSLEPHAIKETLEEARDNASFATPDPFAGLAQPDGMSAVSLELWRDEVGSMSTESKVALALELEAATKAADRRVRSVPSADYADVASETALASTTGIRSATRRTACWLVVEASAGEGDDTQTAYAVATGRCATDLDPHYVAGDAASRAVRMLGAKKASSGLVTVVFEPRVTGTLMGLLGGALSGEAVEKGRSLFAGRLGEPIGSELLTLLDDPTDPAAPGASAFDAEGLACRRNVLIEKGVLQRYLYDSYSGRRAGVPSTASAVRAGYRSGPGVGARALALAPGSETPDEIVARLGDAFVVQSISGVHSGVNPVSGDFSVGAEGIVVRQGEPAQAVREVTIASTVQRMLGSVVAVGSDVEWLPGGSAGVSLAIADMRLSGS